MQQVAHGSKGARLVGTKVRFLRPSVKDRELQAGSGSDDAQEGQRWRGGEGQESTFASSLELIPWGRGSASRGSTQYQIRPLIPTQLSLPTNEPNRTSRNSSMGS